MPPPPRARSEVEVAADGPAPGEPMDVKTALQLVLKKALAYHGLARGLREACKAREPRSRYAARPLSPHQPLSDNGGGDSGAPPPTTPPPLRLPTHAAHPARLSSPPCRRRRRLLCRARANSQRDADPLSRPPPAAAACAQAVESRKAKLAVLAQDCDQPDYTKLIQALCSEANVNLITVETKEQLGEWVGLCKLDTEGKARKVVACSCVVITDYGLESEALSVLEEYLKSRA